MQITVLHTRAVAGMTDTTEVCGSDVATALFSHWPSDAHCTAYAPTTAPIDGEDRRVVVRLLSETHDERPSLYEAREVLDPPAAWMVLLIGDIDAPQKDATAAWRKTVEASLADTRKVYYRTRGGYRILAPLEQPIEIRTAADATAWSTLYRAWCDSLLEEYGLELDRQCSDWTRCYRLPNVMRDAVEERSPILWCGTELPNEELIRVRLAGTAVVGVSLPSAAAPATPRASAAPASTAIERARAIAERLPPSIEGMGGDAALLRVATEVGTVLGPDAGAIEDVLADVFNPRCQPPWPAAKLKREAKRSAERQADPAAAYGRRAAERQAQAAPFAPAPDSIGRDPEVDNIIHILATEETLGIFQRGGALVAVTREPCQRDGVVRAEGSPTIRELPIARLREIISTCVDPKSQALAAKVVGRGQWDLVRPLDALVSYPVLRADGTVLATSGYDAATRTLADIHVDVDVPSMPTHADAAAALDTLYELVVDFPFDSEASKSSWLALLLTLLARPAIDGPTPLSLFDATQRGSGKSLLIDLVSMIATGQQAPRRVAPKTREEWDKTMLSVLMAGDPLMMLDNVTQMLVSDALDAVLTGTIYQQRMLGVSEDRRVAIRTVFAASANNARLSADIVRRAIRCRLEPEYERPERRTDFVIPDLLGHLRAHRPRYLCAAMVILRAYAYAGRPPVASTPIGSFASWARVVRDALVWAGAADPVTTQDALRESADIEYDQTEQLLTAWYAVLGSRQVAVRELLHAAGHDGLGMVPTDEKQCALYDAIAALVPEGKAVSVSSVGYRLRSLRGQYVQGLMLRAEKKRDRTLAWFVGPCLRASEKSS